MSEIAYTVAATIPDEGTCREYVAWLEGGHIEAVIAGGASTGRIVRLDEPADAIVVETHYLFPSREAFDLYVENTAPSLRADGLARWPGRGVHFDRRIGRVISGETA